LLCYKDEKSVVPDYKLFLNGVVTEKEPQYGDDKSIIYALKVSYQNGYMYIAGKTEAERDEWRQAIMKGAEFPDPVLAGYIIRRADGLFDRSSTKYIVQHTHFLSVHTDHEHLAAPLDYIDLKDEIDIQYNDIKLKIKVKDVKAHSSIIMQFDSGQRRDYEKWKEHIKYKLWTLKSRGPSEYGVQVTTNMKGDNALCKTGVLHVRSRHDMKYWPECKVTLNVSRLTIAVDQSAADDVGTLRTSFAGEESSSNVEIVLNPDCAVVDTHMMAYAFELVTDQMIVHFAGHDAAEAKSWMSILGSAISESQLVTSEDILWIASERAKKDRVYEVTFNEVKSLGIVMKRVAEWALVTNTLADSGVKVGSVLTSVNEHFVMFKPYSDVLNLLRNWHPPLKLQFREAPIKHGILNSKVMHKFSKGEDGELANFSNDLWDDWTSHHVSMTNGVLQFLTSSTVEEGMPPLLEAEISLTGSSVSLVPVERSGRLYTFRVLTGTAEVILQADDKESMMDWTGSLYHGIAIANGGGFILAQELARIKLMDERRRRANLLEAKERDAVLAAEDDRIASAITAAIENENVIALQQALQEAREVGLEGELIDYANEWIANLFRERADLEGAEQVEMLDPAAIETIMDEIPASLPPPPLPNYSNATAENDNDIAMGEMPRDSLADILDRQSIAGSPVNLKGFRTIEEARAMLSKHVTNDAFDAKNNKNNIVSEIVIPEKDMNDLYDWEEATEEDLLQLFMKYSRGKAMHTFENDAGQTVTEEQYFITVMTFSTIWRLVTGRKGNLFKEMEIFNKLNSRGDTSMVANDFVTGWLRIGRTQPLVLKRIKKILAGENVIL
jgi:hypothetical protein